MQAMWLNVVDSNKKPYKCFPSKFGSVACENKIINLELQYLYKLNEIMCINAIFSLLALSINYVN